MGLYDRDYTQFDDRSEPHFGGRLSSHPAWLIILIITVAAFLIDALLFSRSHHLNYWLSVSDDTLYRPWLWWQWGTYALAHAPGNINHILFNMLALYFFGSAMEQRLGRAEFTRFYIAAVVLGGIAWSLLNAVAVARAGGEGAGSLMMGASGGVQAVTILFCFCYPHAKILLFFVLPVKAWIVGVMFVVTNLFGALGGGGNTAFEVHLAGIAFSAAYFLGGWNLGAVMPDWLGGSGRGGSRSGGSLGGLVGRFRARPKLRLHDPDKKLAKEAAEADRVLQKIHESGEASLTSAERRLLERYSRRIRGK